MRALRAWFQSVRSCRAMLRAAAILSLVGATLLPATAAAQAPVVTVKTIGYQPITQWTRYTTDYHEIVIQICSPGYLLSVNATLTKASGSSSLTLQDGMQATCPDGGTAYYTDLTLEPDLNTIFVEATNDQYQYASYSLRVIYIPPYRAKVTAGGDGGLRVPPSTVQPVPFTVTNSGSTASAFSVSVSCTGSLSACKRVSDNATAFTTATLAPGASESYILSATAGATVGSGMLSATAVPYGLSAISDAASTPIAIATTAAPPPTVARGRDTVAVAPSTSRNAQFTVTNPDPFASRTISLSATCGTLTSCAVSPSSVTLAPNRDSTIAVSFSVPGSPSTQTTKVVLTASATNPSQTVKDSSWIKVGTVGAPVVTVNVADYSPGSSVSRDQCLSIAAGQNAGVECAALRVAHGMPGVRTMGVERAPTLLYLSDHAYPTGRLAAQVSVRNLVTTDSIKATVTIGAATWTYAWPWTPECATSAGCRIATPVFTQSTSLTTGLHDYTLQVKIGNGGGAPTGQATGKLLIVDNRASAFGAGWWLEGYERLLAVPGSSTTMLWIGGDGSSRLYVQQNDSIFTAQQLVSRPDTLKKRSTEWVRILRNGGQVKFNLGLQHVATVNRQGHQTTFNYAGNPSKLVSIDLPVPSSTTRQFTFTYSGTAPTRIESITGPAQTGSGVRTTALQINSSGQLTQVTDPDGGAVKFTYWLTSASLMTRRINRLNDTTTFNYDNYGAASTIAVHMRGAAAIVTELCAAETRSLVTCAADGAPARPAAGIRSTTLLNGPRSDVSDLTRFFVGRFGAPDTIVDALGARTRLKRANTTFPALVTEVTDPAGLVTRTNYNARGLPDSVRVVAPYGGADAVSRYRWHAKWDMAVRMQSPTNEVDTIAIDNATGNRLWQRRGAHDSTRVSFSYDGYNRLSTVLTTLLGTVNTVTYDGSLGNVYTSTDVLGATTTSLQNAVGADTSVTSPIDGTNFLRDRVVYDVMGRVVRSESIAPAVGWNLNPVASLSGTAPGRTTVVKTEYDAEGRSWAVTRFTMPDSSSGATAKTWVVYDAAGRTTQKHEWHTSANDSLFYDPAGNLVRSVSRRGLVTTQTYDALNRVIARITPRVSFTRVVCWECHNVGYLIPFNDTVFAPDYGTRVGEYQAELGLTIPAEITHYGYDAAGRMIQADNEVSRIRRGYYANGALKSDTTWVRSYDPDVYDLFPTTNRSVLSYVYDLSGRRTTRTDHQTGTQTYSYDALGQLGSTTDQAVAGGTSLTTNFSYDAAGRLLSQTVPAASVTASWVYDNGGRPIRRNEEAFADTIWYDLRGKRTRVVGRTLMNDAGQAGTVVGYDALGQVVASANDDANRPLVTDEITMDALGNTKVRHANRFSTTFNTEARDSSIYLGHKLISRVGEHYPDGRNGGDPSIPAIILADSLGLQYDNSGNVIYQTLIKRRRTGSQSTGWTGRDSVGHSWNWSYFDGAERLRFAQRTAMNTNSGNRTVFSEYWYDALGRRIATRSRVDTASFLNFCPVNEVSASPDCQQEWIRTTWDGDQVLFESRKGGGWQQPDNAVGTYLPDQVWYGDVRYTQTGAIDAPVIVWRSNEQPRVLHRNWRGTVAGATFAAGPSVGSADVSTVWPAAVSDVWYAPDSRQSAPPPNKWLGSLVTEGKDATGTLYRRNRYYDPVSGRFTQEDPIGLAGGLNLYGYAGGDPINWSDPFGLSTDSTQKGNSSTGAQGAEVMPASEIVSVFPLGNIPGRTTGYVSNTKLEALDAGVDLFLSVNARGDVIIAGRGRVRVHLDGLPDLMLNRAAMNLTSGDYEYSGRLNMPIPVPVSGKGNINDVPKTAPAAPPKSSLKCMRAVGCRQ